MTVAGLADEYGTGVKEILALCRLLGIKARDGASVLSAPDVARMRDVLDGRVPLPTVGVAKRQGDTGRTVLMLVRVAVVVGLAVLGFVAVSSVVNEDAAIYVRAGQCFDDPGFFESTLAPVPCDGPHDFVAYGTLDLDEVFDAWPGVDEMTEHAEARCQALGEQTGQTAWQFYWFGPRDETAWADEDTHRIVCAVPAE